MECHGSYHRPLACPHCRVALALPDAPARKKWDALVLTFKMSALDVPSAALVARATKIHAANPLTKRSASKEVRVLEKATDTEEAVKAGMMLKLFTKGKDTTDIARMYRMPEADVVRLIHMARQIKRGT